MLITDRGQRDTLLAQGKAYTLTLSSDVEAVKQMEILFAMGGGVLLFGEAQRCANRGGDAARDAAPGPRGVRPVVCDSGH